MRSSFKAYLVGAILIWAGCESPFTSKPTADDSFKITTNYDGRPLIDTLIIELSWTEIQIEFFDSLAVQIFVPDAIPLVWQTLKTVTDTLIFAYTDTVDDDANIKYRVLIFDVDHNLYSAETILAIPEVTSLTVPTSGYTIQQAIDRKTMDSGDTIYVLPGTYFQPRIDYRLKQLIVIGTGGASQTILTQEGRLDKTISTAKSENLSAFADNHLGPYIDMGGGLFQGFSIINTVTNGGGAIRAINGAVIRQVMIHNNQFEIDEMVENSDGGGMHLAGTVLVQNCIISGSSSLGHGGGIYVDGYAIDIEIVNCTIYGNRSQLPGTGIFAPGGPGRSVNIENSIIWFNNISQLGGLPRLSYNLIDTSRINSPQFVGFEFPNNGSEVIDVNSIHLNNVDSTHIWDDPLINSVSNLDFHLQPSSPAIDAGNPDPLYNDVDGSRNDLGAFGGPYGDW